MEVGFKEVFLFLLSMECLNVNEKGLKKRKVLETKVVGRLNCRADGGAKSQAQVGACRSK